MGQLESVTPALTGGMAAGRRLPKDKLSPKDLIPLSPLDDSRLGTLLLWISALPPQGSRMSHLTFKSVVIDSRSASEHMLSGTRIYSPLRHCSTTGCCTSLIRERSKPLDPQPNTLAPLLREQEVGSFPQLVAGGRLEPPTASTFAFGGQHSDERFVYTEDAIGSELTGRIL